MEGYYSDLLEKIESVIALNIRPSLRMDGGDISVVSLEGNTLFVKLQGACSCCPRSAETLKYGVEATLRQMISTELIVKSVQ
jgi:NifU-like protein